ncbi:MAG: hypothetical protein FD123_310 [Bacteroidetes bacterium]|nr:MAG: hypothetical protein FD123_310 [Bacteroidota bacterium]
MTFKNPGRGINTLALAALVVFTFLGLGFLLVFTDAFIDNIKHPNRIYVGVGLMVWSVMRAWLAWRKYKRDNENREHEEE